MLCLCIHVYGLCKEWEHKKILFDYSSTYYRYCLVTNIGDVVDDDDCDHDDNHDIDCCAFENDDDIMSNARVSVVIRLIKLNNKEI